MAANRVRRLQGRVVNLLLLNLLIAFVLPSLFTVFGGLSDGLIAFAAGLVVLSVADRRYGIYLLRSLRFLANLSWEILLSNINIAWLVLQPKPRLDPGIVAIPLDVTTNLEVMTLASAITLTPGTISVDLGRNATGQRVLYIHALVVGDPEQLRASIKQGFERRIIGISSQESYAK